MAARAQLIAEICTNWGGDIDLGCQMVKAAADSGADWVKTQLFNAAMLADDDPQKAWLTQAQITRPMLDALMATAAAAGVKLTASVFGIPEARMAQEAGLTTIKIGSGDSGRLDLLNYCAGRFRDMWISDGMGLHVDAYHVLARHRPAVPFYGLSQYPAPISRNYARLLQCEKASGPWGWSDHGHDLTVAHQALHYGCHYLERHFTLPHAGRRQAWDSVPSDFTILRKQAEALAWEGTEAWQQAVDKFRNRWTHGAA